jgi:hypothetical protein
VTITRLSYGYPLAEQEMDGTWTVHPPDSVVTGEFGTFRIEIGGEWDTTFTTTTHEAPTLTTAGTDITTIDGVPSLLTEYSFAEPYGELQATVVLPRVTIFDVPAWMNEGANIDIYRVLGAAEAIALGRDEVPFWHGLVDAVSAADNVGVRDAISLSCMGALYAEASMRAHQPILKAMARDIGTSIAHCLDPLSYSRPFNPYRFMFVTAETGILTRERGSRGQMVIDFVDQMLTLAQDSGGQWTISRAFDVDDQPQARKYYLRLKSEELAGAVQENTVFAGGFGVSLSAVSDLTQAVNAVYGEGLDPTDQSRWRNMKYPELFPSQPAYPDRVAGADYPVTEGDEDADFTADVVTQLQYALRSGGHYFPGSISGIFDADTTTALEVLQEDAGVTVTGTIEDNGDWDLVFTTDAQDTDLSSGYARPLSEVLESAAYTYAPNGAVTGTNGDYDGRVRVERPIAYGDSSKNRARKHARRVTTAAIDGAPRSHTLTLTCDQAERSRHLTREGSWTRINSLQGGTYEDVYVAAVKGMPETDGLPVELTVAEKAFDLLELAARMERNRSAQEDPAKSFYSLRTKQARSFKSAVGWDKEASAGILRPFDHPGGEWVVTRIIGAQSGSIESLTARATSDATEFALAIFGEEITAATLAGIIADPLAEDADYLSPFNNPANEDDLAAVSWVETWGAFDEPGGYFPGAKSRATAITGRCEDAMSWRFISTDEPYLWVAVWCVDPCTFRATMRIVADE